jgi:hypothetical protein
MRATESNTREREKEREKQAKAEAGNHKDELGTGAKVARIQR